MSKIYPCLSQIFGSYFHQDWFLEFESSDEVLLGIVKNEPKDVLRSMQSEIKNILQTLVANGNAEDFLMNDLGCYFHPKSERYTIKNWLERVCEVIENAI